MRYFAHDFSGECMLIFIYEAPKYLFLNIVCNIKLKLSM